MFIKIEIDIKEMGLIYINLMVCFKKKTFYVNIYNYLFFKEKKLFSYLLLKLIYF